MGSEWGDEKFPKSKVPILFHEFHDNTVDRSEGFAAYLLSENAAE